MAIFIEWWKTEFSDVNFWLHFHHNRDSCVGTEHGSMFINNGNDATAVNIILEPLLSDEPTFQCIWSCDQRPQAHESIWSKWMDSIVTQAEDHFGAFSFYDADTSIPHANNKLIRTAVALPRQSVPVPQWRSRIAFRIGNVKIDRLIVWIVVCKRNYDLGSGNR